MVSCTFAISMSSLKDLPSTLILTEPQLLGTTKTYDLFLDLQKWPQNSFHHNSPLPVLHPNKLPHLCELCRSLAAVAPAQRHRAVATTQQAPRAGAPRTDDRHPRLPAESVAPQTTGVHHADAELYGGLRGLHGGFVAEVHTRRGDLVKRNGNT